MTTYKTFDDYFPSLMKDSEINWKSKDRKKKNYAG